MKSMFTSKTGRLVITSKKAINLLHKMSVKQGKKYDDPASTAEIPSFVRLHSLNMDEAQNPIHEFKTFNEFFYRSLKPNARPVAQPDNAKVAVCPAVKNISFYIYLYLNSKLYLCVIVIIIIYL